MSTTTAQDQTLSVNLGVTKYVVDLKPGITTMNAYTKLYATFISIAMLTGMSFLQPYVLEVNLEYPRASQGEISGWLTFWTEIVTIVLFAPVGVIADKIGRRPVYIFGIVTIGIGYGLYPFSDNLTEMFIYRMIYAVGLAAVAGMLATISNDYPKERSRGKYIGISSMMNILGTIMMSTGIARIPFILTERGVDELAAGQVMFLLSAGLCMITAVVARLGLASGTPVAKKDRENVKVLITSGLRNGLNPRIALSYAAAFSARSDLVIKGMFLSLWGVQASQDAGISTGQGMAQVGIVFGIMNGFSFFCAPLYGALLDRINRVSGAIIALAFACVGYTSMRLVETPLDFTYIPLFIILGLGSSFLLKASVTLVGQEAPEKERASVVAMNGTFGAIGILIFAVYGGIYFDAWGPWAPFFIAGVWQCVLLIAAIVIRIFAPGPDLVGSGATKLAGQGAPTGAPAEAQYTAQSAAGGTSGDAPPASAPDK